MSGNGVIRKYKESPNKITQQEKDKLVIEYAPLIKFIAQKILLKPVQFTANRVACQLQNLLPDIRSGTAPLYKRLLRVLRSFRRQVSAGILFSKLSVNSIVSLDVFRIGFRACEAWKRNAISERVLFRSAFSKILVE